MTNLPCSSWLALFERCTETLPQPAKRPTVAIANPPFGKANAAYNDLNHFELGHSWKQTNGTFTRTNRMKQATETEALFTELCIRLLQPKEVVVLLVPNGLLNATSLLYARKWIETHTQIMASIQLPPEAWKAECKLGLVTSLLVLRRKASDEPDTDYNIFMAMCERCGYDSRGKRLYQKDATGKPNAQVDDDLPKIVTGFQTFLAEESTCG